MVSYIGVKFAKVLRLLVIFSLRTTLYCSLKSPLMNLGWLRISYYPMRKPLVNL
ncbi:hypothetical protein PTKIN_Ptkin19aG0006800 [Pterospermum kingtungense]